MNVKNVLIVLLFATLAVSCSAAKRDTALKADQDTLVKATGQGDLEKALAEADGYWAKRSNKSDLVHTIETLEKAVSYDSPNLSKEERAAKLAETYEWLARAYYFLADSHVRLEATDDEKDAEMMGIFEQGVTAAEKAIALRDPTFTSAVAADQNAWGSAVKNADPKTAPALYWYATNLGKWALLEGIATILKRKDDIKATMDWIVATDETYFYGAPHRYFGTYHTKVPIGTGNAPGSKVSFEKSMEMAPGYLATRVLMAENYAVLVGDRALYETLLNDVINADPNAVPAITPENVYEQKKAKRLLEQAEDKFY